MKTDTSYILQHNKAYGWVEILSYVIGWCFISQKDKSYSKPVIMLI